MAESIVVKYEADLAAFKTQLTELANKNIALTKQVEDLGKKVESTSKKSADATSALGNKFDELGKQIAAAFSVAAVIAFGKTSIEAFAEAELSARKLNSALSAQGGTQAQLKTLLNQSKELQKTTIFSDEQIQAAQTLAIQFGLTTTEVSKLIPIIADFASATGQDLQSALESVLRGSEGVARGLKVYGIQVDTTGTKTSRLAQITEQLTQKFGGQAQQVGETTTGSFQKLKNAFNDLEESIGAILAKGGGFIDFLGDVIQGLNRFLKTEQDVKREDFEFLSNKAKEAALKNLEELRTKLTASGKDANDAFRILISESNTIITEKRKQLNATWDTQTKDAIREQIKLEEVRIQALQDIQKDEAKIRKRAADEQADEDAKTAKQRHDAAVKDAKERIDATKALREFTLKAELDNITAEQTQRETAAGKEITDQQELQQVLRQIQIEQDLKRRAVQIEFGADTVEIDKKISDEIIANRKENEKQITDNVKEGLDERLKAIKDAAGKELAELAGKKLSVQEFEREKLQITKRELEAEIEANRKAGKDIGELLGQLGEVNKKIADDTQKAFVESFQKISGAAQDLLSSLNELFSAQNDADIERINSNKDAQVEAIDAQIKSLEEANDKGRISDKKLEQEKKRLLAERTAAEKKADEEQRKIKVKQAEQDKLLSIFRIGLILAEAIASVDVIKIIAATAELAVVIAKPVPQFAKGTKGKKETGMGMVGEQGREFLWMPKDSKVVPHAQTEKYKAAIDAMIDNKYEDYVYKAMIAPALREATRKLEKDRQKSFAENVANSFTLNKNEFNEYRMRDALKANNKDNATAIAHALRKYFNNNTNDRYYH